MGDYKITLEDANGAKKFKDVIGKSVMPMGSHHVATTQTIITIPGLEYGIKDGGSFDLPYRILVPQKVENMLVAGKMVSTDRNSYLRFLPDTMVTGQAAGTAAALCAQKGLTPREMEKTLQTFRMPSLNRSNPFRYPLETVRESNPGCICPVYAIVESVEVYG